MGYLAETITAVRLAEPLAAGSGAVNLWHVKTMAEWLISVPDGFVMQRLAMVEAIRQRLSVMIGRLNADDIERALAAMATVPRESFICPMADDFAYFPVSMAIGLDQTISHPDLVAVLAATVRGGYVLDVGTGSGYQAAVLAQMADRVISVEILADHAALARSRLDRLGYSNIEVITGDAGAPGMFAPHSFDAIVVAAGAATVPAELIAALKVGGRMVMPLGATQDDEHLVLIEKIVDDELRHTVLRPARFVPLTGHGSRGPAVLSIKSP